jgi:hypothetical protein
MTSGNDKIAYFSALIDYIRMKFYTWMQNRITHHRPLPDCWISISGFKKSAKMTSGNDKIAYFSAFIE